MGFPFEKEIQVLKNNKKRGGGGCVGEGRRRKLHILNGGVIKHQSLQF